MPKKCNSPNCLLLVFGGGYCKNHQHLRVDKIKKPPKKNAPIKKQSTKMKKDMKEYSNLRDIFLKEHPLCAAKLINCTRIATDVHHKKGRVGRRNCPIAA